MSEPVVIGGVREANTFLSRLLGLTGGRSAGGARLWIPRCRSVHTCFMLQPLDIVFLSQTGAVMKIARNVRSWRFLVGPAGSVSVLEGEAGFADGCALREGVRVEWS